VCTAARGGARAPDNRLSRVGVPARERIADDAAGRTTENALKPGEVRCADEPAVARHELDARALHAPVPEFLVEAREEAVEVRAQHRRQVRVRRRAHPARDEPDHRQQRGALGDMREAHLAGEPAQQLLVRRVRVAVHKHDRHAPEAVVVESL
jgi:hypothetical protein